MYDVIILGAGVAGSYLAQLLKKNDINFLLIDKEDKNEHFKDDSGVVSKEFLHLMKDIDMNGKNIIRDRIKEMDFVSPDKNTVSIRGEENFAYVLNKKILEEKLHNGLTIKKEKAWKIDIFNDHAHVWTDKNDYKCDIVVGADGADSFVRNQMNMEKPKIVNGLLLRTKKRGDKKNVQVYFNKDYSEYYAWHVPKNREYGLILDVNNKGKTKMHLENFKRDMDIEDTDDIEMEGAIIPYGFVKNYSKRCFLVGDAGSQTKPLTFGGIVFSMKCVKRAFETIKECVESRDFSESFLKEYDNKWHKDIGNIIKKQMLFRKIYAGLNNNDIERIFDIVKDDVNKIDLKNYDYPMELWSSLKKTTKAKIIFKSTKGFLKGIGNF